MIDVHLQKNSLKAKKSKYFYIKVTKIQYFQNVAPGHEVIVEFDSWFKNSKISLPCIQ